MCLVIFDRSNKIVKESRANYYTINEGDETLILDKSRERIIVIEMAEYLKVKHTEGAGKTKTISALRNKYKIDPEKFDFSIPSEDDIINQIELNRESKFKVDEIFND